MPCAGKTLTESEANGYALALFRKALAMHPLCPLIGVLILSAVLTTNYFRTAWRLGILRAFGRRATLNWRVLTAGCLAGCLPFIGSVLALSIVPAGASGTIEASALGLAMEMSLCGLVMHALNDVVMAWGASQPA